MALDFGSWGPRSLQSQFFTKASFCSACYRHITLELYCLADPRHTLSSLGLSFSINRMRQLGKISKFPVSLAWKAFSMTTVSKQQFLKVQKCNLSSLFPHALNYMLTGSWLMTRVLWGSEGFEWIITPFYRWRHWGLGRRDYLFPINKWLSWSTNLALTPNPVLWAQPHTNQR